MIAMKIIWIVVSIILLIFTYIKLNSIISPFISSKYVFKHPIKTHQNGIINFRTNAIMFLFICITIMINIEILIYLNLVLSSIFVPLSFYIWSEIKHLSPKDGLYEKNEEAHKYYKTYSNFGLINMINNLLLIIFIAIDLSYNYFFYLFLAIEIILSILCGMCDLLNLSGQYKTTLSQDKYLKEQNKQMVIQIPRNIIYFFINKKSRDEAITNLKINLQNIKLGIKQTKK